MWWLRFRPPAGVVFWVCHAVFWLAAFATGILVVRVVRPTLADPVAILGGHAVVGFVLTAAVRSVARQRGLLDRLGISKVGLLVGGPLIAAVVMTLGGTAIDRLLGGGSGFGEGLGATRTGVLARFLVTLAPLAAWSAAYFGVHLLRDQRAAELRAFEAEALAARTELAHLHAQISPHFLFNSLNTILACRHAPDDIEAITQSLAKYLRFLLRPIPTLEPLGRELGALEDYLTIQSFRFGQRLRCRIDCDGDIRRIPVLPAMIQPLVENAIKYGQPGGDGPLEVTVRAFREGDRLFVEVANTGRWVGTSPPGATRTGLETLRRRLALHGGPDATVTTTEDAERVVVTIRIPLAPEFAAGPLALETPA